MRIDIWSDLVCPWCYVGKRRFERALATFEHRDRVEVVHRSFQLNPRAERATRPRREALKAKYHLSDGQVQAVDDRMERIAAAEGLQYRLSGSLTGNTVDGHRLLHLARERGIQDAVIERFYRAYFTEQRSLFDEGSLVTLAAEAGLDPDETRRVLAEGTYAASVAADVAEAATLGVNGVPYLLIDRGAGISGAQSTAVFLDALRQSWRNYHPD